MFRSFDGQAFESGACGVCEGVENARGAVSMARQMLEEVLVPPRIPMESLVNLPDEVYAMPDFYVLSRERDAQAFWSRPVELLEIGQPERGKLQQMMIRFLQGGFRKLRLIFGREAGRRKVIVLFQDGGRFLMAWLQEERQTVRFHVADAGTYMDVEGKKYPKDTFQGRIIPAYLIHNGVIPLRNALELLLANLDRPAGITDKIAEYTEEKPVKARSYEELWAELAGDTL